MGDASFDVVSELDFQEVSNAIGQALKEVGQRYDLKDAASEIDLNQKESKIDIGSADEYKVKAVLQILETKLVKRGVSLKALQIGEVESALGGRAKMKIGVQVGIDKEKGKLINKEIKNLKLKVNASLQGEVVRVSGKKRDDLQAVISFLKEKDFGVPLQFVNFR